MEGKGISPMKIIANPSSIGKIFLSNAVWTSNKKNILLTFDDGPTKDYTNLILKKLDEHKIKAMFFCVGQNILNNISLTKEIISCGHKIGNHSMNHQKIFFVNEIEFNNQIISVNKIIYDELGINLKHYRPPYGITSLGLNKRIINSNMKLVLWSLLSYDYQNDFNKVKFTVKKYLCNNSIVVLHDNEKSSKIIERTIDFIVETAVSKNYTFGVPEECLN